MSFRTAEMSELSVRRLFRTAQAEPVCLVHFESPSDCDIFNCFNQDDSLAFVSISRVITYLEFSSPPDFDSFCSARFPYERFVEWSLSRADTPTGALAFLCLELACNFHGVSLSRFQPDSLLALIFLKLRSSDPDQSDAAFHILSDLTLSSDCFLDELIGSGLLDSMRLAAPTTHFGSLFSLLCSRKCDRILDVLCFLPTVLLSATAKCVGFGLMAIENCIEVNPATAADLSAVVQELSPRLFARPELGIAKQLFRCLSVCASLPLSFIPLVLSKMTTCDCPALIDLGCRVFRQQFPFWKSAVPDSLCDFIFDVIDGQDYACQCSCLRTLLLYYDYHENLCRFTELLIAHLEDEDLTLECLQAMLAVLQRSRPDAALFVRSFATVAELAASDDRHVSEAAHLILSNVWNENGEIMLSSPFTDAQDGAV
jgi:hypothetical protein